jgi:eukaryotic-like serine/threonine-protein kinase
MRDSLGHYKLLNLLGTGRLGEVYRARDLRAGRTVALRVVTNEIEGHADRRARFLKDATATASLSHPNIAALYEIGEDQGHLFFASEFVPGETLKAVIAGRALNPRHAIDYGIQIADALADGHAASILFRDLNPSNVIITPKGTAKLLEFGLAHWVGEGPLDLIYVSPELKTDGPIDHRTDLYSLGVVLFEMLTGRLPLSLTKTGGSSEAPPSVSTLNRALPTQLDAIVSKLMAADPSDRYQLTAMVAADLRAAAAALDAPAAVRPPASAAPVQTSRPVPGPTVRPSGRRGSAWIRAALIAAAIIGALWLVVSAFGGRWRTSVGSVRQPAIGPSAESRPTVEGCLA